MASARLARGVLALGLVLAGGAPASAQVPFAHVVIDASVAGDCKGVGDIDGDGQADVVLGGAALAWYRWPDWQRSQIAVAGREFTTDMQVADVDSDLDPDIVVPDYGDAVFWFENPRPGGDPATAAWVQHRVGARGWAHDLEVGDLDGDGRLDVVTRQDTAEAWLQRGPDSWQRLDLVEATPGGEGVAVGDLDGDRDLDLAMNGFWLENDGLVFRRRDIDSGRWPTLVGVHIADLSGDGRADVLLAPSESAGGRLSWYEAADPVRGPWSEHVIDPDVGFIHTFKTADIDRDGRLDVVTAEMFAEVAVHYNGGAALSWTRQLLAATGSHNLRVGDIGGDGDLDVVGANYIGNPPLEMWENQSPPLLPRVAVIHAVKSLPAAVRLSWTYPGAPGLAGFNVQRSADEGVQWAKLGAPGLLPPTTVTTGHDDPVVGDGASYWYRVRAVSTGGVESGD